MSLFEKIETVAKSIYHASEVIADKKVRDQLREWEAQGYGNLPVCMAKTQYSFSTDPNLRGAPEGHTLPIREVRLSAGAGFVVVICGEIMTMPGLPRVPASETIRLERRGSDRGSVLNRAAPGGVSNPARRAGPSAPVCVFLGKMKGQGMVATLIDGKAFAERVRRRVAEEVARLKQAHGIVPGLAVVLVGEDPASQVYVRNKGKQTIEAGMASFEHKLDADTPEADVLALVDQLNVDPAVHGILVQLPLPKHCDADKVINRIAPEKDVDGFHISNVGLLGTGQKALVPCTPLGCLMMLRDHHGEPVGQWRRSSSAGPISWASRWRSCLLGETAR
jgi:hypothetical protein